MAKIRFSYASFWFVPVPNHLIIPMPHDLRYPERILPAAQGNRCETLVCFISRYVRSAFLKAGTQSVFLRLPRHTRSPSGVQKKYLPPQRSWISFWACKASNIAGISLMVLLLYRFFVLPSIRLPFSSKVMARRTWRSFFVRSMKDKREWGIN